MANLVLEHYNRSIWRVYATHAIPLNDDDHEYKRVYRVPLAKSAILIILKGQVLHVDETGLRCKIELPRDERIIGCLDDGKTCVSFTLYSLLTEKTESNIILRSLNTGRIVGNTKIYYRVIGNLVNNRHIVCDFHDYYTVLDVVTMRHIQRLPTVNPSGMISVQNNHIHLYNPDGRVFVLNHKSKRYETSATGCDCINVFDSMTQNKTAVCQIRTNSASFLNIPAQFSSYGTAFRFCPEQNKHLVNYTDRAGKFTAIAVDKPNKTRLKYALEPISPATIYWDSVECSSPLCATTIEIIPKSSGLGTSEACSTFGRTAELTSSTLRRGTRLKGRIPDPKSRIRVRFYRPFR